MTGPVTVTVRGVAYTVEAEPDHTGEPGLFLYDQLGGHAGQVMTDGTAIPPSATVVGATGWWTGTERRQAARAAITAHQAHAPQEVVPEVVRCGTCGSTRPAFSVPRDCGHCGASLPTVQGAPS